MHSPWIGKLQPTLQLDKCSWPLQILLVCRLGKGSTTPETQTSPAPNHPPPPPPPTCCSISLHLKRSTRDSEPPDIF